MKNGDVELHVHDAAPAQGASRDSWFDGARGGAKSLLVSEAARARRFRGWWGRRARAAPIVVVGMVASSCSDLPTQREFERKAVPIAYQISGAIQSTAPTRIVTFGDSNTDWGYEGSKVVAGSYVSHAPRALAPHAPHSPYQLAGKIERQWAERRSDPLTAVNHAISGTTTDKGQIGGSPNARYRAGTEITRYEAEVLGVGAPNWSGGEPVSKAYPSGPVARVNAYVPDSRSFAYVSMGTVDIKRGIAVRHIAANLAWMIDLWVSAGQDARRFIITTLPPNGYSDTSILNDSIRALASRAGVHLIDLAAYTSLDNGLTWRDSKLHVDGTNYVDGVREWLAQQIVFHIEEVIPGSPPSSGAPTATFTISPAGPYQEADVLTFDGSSSSDPNGDLLTYHWTFGDGATASGVAVTHAYRDNGSFTAILKVTNPFGQAGQSERILTINNAAPVVDAGPDAQHVIGSPFYPRPRFEDAGADDGPWSYTIHWGNGATTSGSVSTQGTLSQPSHVYASPGSYPVQVIVKDKDGGEGTDILVVTVTTGFAAPIRIVTFGDSNTDWGYEGSKVVAGSYVSHAPRALAPDAPHSPYQLAGKIERQWAERRSDPLTAVNHAISGTTTDKGQIGGSPNARYRAGTEITRYEAEVLGVGAPNWSGGEPVSKAYPNGPVARVNAYVPDSRSFAYVSMGTNDIKRGTAVRHIAANLAWMIDLWVSAGQDARRFIITTLPPNGYSDTSILNDSIRALASRAGVHLIDLAAYTSLDNGLTWRSSDLHFDGTHYRDGVREWLAQQIVYHIDGVIPGLASSPASRVSPASYELALRGSHSIDAGKGWQPR